MSSNSQINVDSALQPTRGKLLPLLTHAGNHAGKRNFSHSLSNCCINALWIRTLCCVLSETGDISLLYVNLRDTFIHHSRLQAPGRTQNNTEPNWFDLPASTRSCLCAIPISKGMRYWNRQKNNSDRTKNYGQRENNLCSML